MALEQLLKLISDGEPVTAGVTNRAPAQNDRNVRYLWEVLQAANIGSTVYARKVTIEADALIGAAVYFNATAQRFDRALALIESDPHTGLLQTSASSQVWGVVAFKHNATLADLLLYGYAELDISAVVDGTPAAGIYYLSGVEKGKLVAQQPPVSVPVLRHDGAGRVLVNPQLADFVDRHHHYKFSLITQPAGSHSPPVVGGRHAITSPSILLRGWLPAAHSSFAGKAPPGAKFGYNLATHTALKNTWPPLPVTSAHLEWNRGLEKDVAGTGIPLGPQGLCVLDRNGIWWMSDCYGDVPWPVDFDSENILSLSDSYNECPRELYMELILWFTRINFADETRVVTSLKSIDSRLLVRCVDGTPAQAGDLAIDLDLHLVTSGTDTRGCLVFKELEDETFKRGKVLEGVFAASANVSLISDQPTIKRVVGDPDSADVYQGLVGVAVSQEPTRELPVGFVRHDGTTEEFFQDNIYIGFAAGELTRYRGHISVPADLSLTNPKMRLRFRILGRAAGVLPVMTLTARRVPRPVNGLVTPAALPLNVDEFAVTLATTVTLTATNQYVEAVSAPFTIVAGDVVLFTIGRDDSDTYTGEVGVLQHVGVVTSG